MERDDQLLACMACYLFSEIAEITTPEEAVQTAAAILAEVQKRRLQLDRFKR